jgi:hypothetical protein
VKHFQYGALPYRLRAGLRVRPSRRRFVLGAVAKHSIGSFSYKKRLKNGGVVVCDVRVFLLEVRRQSKRWPEKQERIIKWLSASQAAEKVDEPRLGAIIRRLARNYDGRIRLSSWAIHLNRSELGGAKGIGDRMCPNHDLGVTSRAAGIRRARREASSR